MNWDLLEGKWKQYAGRVKEKWGKLTDDDLEVVGGPTGSTDRQTSGTLWNREAGSREAGG